MRTLLIVLCFILLQGCSGGGGGTSPSNNTSVATDSVPASTVDENSDDESGDNVGPTEDLVSYTEDVAADKANLAITYGGNDSSFSVTQNMTLPTSGNAGSTISWASNAPSVVSNSGAVTRPAYGQSDAIVILIATIFKGHDHDSKVFTIKVIAEE